MQVKKWLLGVWVVVILAAVAGCLFGASWLWSEYDGNLITGLKDWINGEGKTVPRVEAVSIERVLACQRDGMDQCALLRNGQGGEVITLVEGGLYHDTGVVIAGGSGGARLRYLGLVGAGGIDDGVFYCSFDRVLGEAEPGWWDEVAAGAIVLASAQLWWDEGDELVRSYSYFGEPTCRVLMVDGRKVGSL